MFTTPWVPAFQILPWMGISHTWNHKTPTLHLYPTQTPVDEHEHCCSLGTLLVRLLQTGTSHPCLKGLLGHHTQILSSRELLFTRGLCLGAEVLLCQQDPTSPYPSKGTALAWDLCQPFSLFSSQELFHSTCKVIPKISSDFVLIFWHLGQCRLIMCFRDFHIAMLRHLGNIWRERSRQICCFC